MTTPLLVIIESPSGLVCAWCDVYNRVECDTRDEHDRVVCSWTVCAYCGRSELGPKRGRTTPVPKEVVVPFPRRSDDDFPDECPF